MEKIPPAPPKRRNRVTVFLSDATFAEVKARAEAGDEGVGAFLGRMVEHLAPQIFTGTETRESAA